jgi:prefoldin subunit 5
MEKARKIHDALRKWGSWWEDKAGEVEKELGEKIEKLEGDIEKLNVTIDDLRDEVEYFKKERDEALERAKELEKSE